MNLYCQIEFSVRQVLRKNYTRRTAVGFRSGAKQVPLSTGSNHPFQTVIPKLRSYGLSDRRVFRVISLVSFTPISSGSMEDFKLIK